MKNPIEYISVNFYPKVRCLHNTCPPRASSADRILGFFLSIITNVRECIVCFKNTYIYVNKRVTSFIYIAFKSYVKLVFACLLFSPVAHAEIPSEQAVQAIIGEAANQGKIGMIALAEALRNRDSLSGVYGYKRTSFIKSQPKWVHDMARQAWEASKESNLVDGATNWENVKAFGKPYWASSMIKTATIGAHSFYRSESLSREFRKRRVQS